MTHKFEHNKVHYLQVGPEHAGRRIDNYLTGYLKGLPKARIYQMLRKGEVRVNSSRIKQDYRLAEGDDIRIPPVTTRVNKINQAVPTFLQQIFNKNVLYEDDELLVLNKPYGVSVHGGTNQKFGLIECLREFHPDYDFLELVHRLDKDTSGCLMIAKSHICLRKLHNAFKQGKIEKKYLALLKNRIKNKFIKINLPLKKNALRSNERFVRVDEQGKEAMTEFFVKHYYKDLTLAEIRLITGRTHQIRVHAQQIGHPVACDAKYGDRNFNKRIQRAGLKRIFLHAASLKIPIPATGKLVTINAPLPDELTNFLKNYEKHA